MSTTLDKTSDYGWKGEGQVCSHEYLIPVIDKVIEKYRQGHAQVENLRIFDAGCGNGFLAGHLLTCGFETAGCDESATGINIAKQQYPLVRFKVMSVYDDMAGVFGRDWDIVVSSEVIEHLFSPRLFVRRASDLLKPGGLIVLTTPFHGYVKNIVLAATGSLDRHFTALWDGGHIKFWSFKTLKLLLKEQGFEQPTFYGAGRVPYLWKSMVVSAKKPA